MTKLIEELEALAADVGRLHVLPGSDCITDDTALVARFDRDAPTPAKALTAKIVNSLPAILTQLKAAERMREAIRKAAQLASIASDWNLDEVEIDEVMVRTHTLKGEFDAALTPVNEREG